MGSFHLKEELVKSTPVVVFCLGEEVFESELEKEIHPLQRLLSHVLQAFLLATRGAKCVIRRMIPLEVS